MPTSDEDLMFYNLFPSSSLSASQSGTGNSLSLDDSPRIPVLNSNMLQPNSVAKCCTCSAGAGCFRKQCTNTSATGKL